MNISFRASSRASRQYEMQNYTAGDDADLPPPTKPNVRASPGMTIDLERFRDELDGDCQVELRDTTSESFEMVAKQRLLSESVNEALPSGEDRVRSIRLVTGVIALQVLLATICAGFLLSCESLSPGLSLASLFLLSGSCLAFTRSCGSFSVASIVVCFLLFSVSLPLCLSSVPLPLSVLGIFLIQLAASHLAIAIYAANTTHDSWSSVTEKIFAVMPVVFVAVGSTAVNGGDQILAVTVVTTGVAVLSLVYVEVTKDSIVPAANVSQLMSDVLAVHTGVVYRVVFLFRMKLVRLARKANWF